MRKMYYEDAKENAAFERCTDVITNMMMMKEIRRIMPHIKDSDMEDLAGQMLRKLDGMTDKEFAENSLEAVGE